MLPVFAVDDQVDGFLGDAVLSSRLRPGHRTGREGGADVPDVVRTEFGVPAAFPAAKRAVFDFVAFVNFGRVPTEIGQPVVGRIAVGVVPSYKAGRPRTDKRLQDQAMEEEKSSLTVLVQNRAVVPTVIGSGLFDSTSNQAGLAIPTLDPTVNRLQSTPVADAVKAGVTDYVTPPFAAAVGVGLGTLVEGFTEVDHGHLPSWLPEKVGGAGGRDTAFRVYGPSPCCFMPAIGFRQVAELVEKYNQRKQGASRR